MYASEKDNFPPLIICMVGLPARGKTYISRKIHQYLNWLSINTKVFNLGEYRRQQMHYDDYSFFDKDNLAAVAMRDSCLENALTDIILWLENEGKVAVIDATNSSLERRIYLCKYADEQQYNIFFIESICDDPNIIIHNIKEVKTKSPDYIGKSQEEVIDDFQKRIDTYEKQYVPLDAKKEPNISFIKLFNAGKTVEMYNLSSPLQNRITRYLISIHLPPQTVYLSRHGESTHNFEHRIGGDPVLSSRGREYSRIFAKFINDLQIPGLKVWTSSLKRTIETALLIEAPQDRWSALNELNSGICNNMTNAEIRQKWPDIAEERSKNKFYFRYPGGESYHDLVQRLEPLICELELHKNILIISHRATIRCLISYITGVSPEKIPYIYVPLHTLFKLTTTAEGCEVQHINFSIPSTDISS